MTCPSWPTTSTLLRDAFLTTLALAVLSGICALVLGTLLTAMRVSPVKPLRGAATFYVEIFRNTPLTVVFFFLAFGIVEIDLQFPTRFITAVAALSLYTAAFVSEALRSGINSVPPGQAEAARALGPGLPADADHASSCPRRSGPSSRRWATCGSRWRRTPRSPPASRSPNWPPRWCG